MGNLSKTRNKELERQGSPERFGFSWQRFSELSPQQEEQFQRWTSLITIDEWKNKTFADIGCGAGRNSYWAMKYGAVGGLSIDIDERSLIAARNNLKQFNMIEVKNCSIYEIDKDDYFDIVFSIGVIHHLAAPEEAVKNMARIAKPGGKVLVWLYGYENNEWIVKYADPLRKLFFSKLSIPLVYFLSLFPTSILWFILRMNILRIEYFRLLRNFPFRHLRHIVFDQMIPKIAIYYKKDEAIRLLEQAGLENIQIKWINEMSWSVIGIKPENK